VTDPFEPSPWHLQRQIDAAMAKADSGVELARRRAGWTACRTCDLLYPPGGDGFDGECPECADATDRFLGHQD
jgi:hypothetical protein